MALNHNAQKSLFDDTLYCQEQEEKWEDEEGDEEESEMTLNTTSNVSLLEQDLLWDDEELQSLFFKEKETCFQTSDITYFSLERKEAVEWILKINAHYGFSSLTAILAVNYLDKFLLNCLNFQKDKKPWMMQLAAIACLSLAAKVEETHVPLLLDLQVEDAKYVFEAKTIQKMEVLVLSTLQWRMNPVTPLSFLDHIVRRLGLKRYIHWEFLRRCENLLLSVISDSRIIGYMPSVLATATMLHIIHQVEHCNNAMDYENQLLSVLKISKDEVDDCYQLIQDILSKPSVQTNHNNSSKRKSCQLPIGVMSIMPSDASNDSWGSLSSCISSSSTHHPILKKRRVQEQQMKLPSLSRVFVDAIKSPH